MKNILWAFIIFYGYTFEIGRESQGSDINRYVAEIVQLHQLEMDYGVALNYYRDSGEIDILRTFLAIVISRFTDQQKIVTAVYAVFFGFFFSRNFAIVFHELKGKIKPIPKLLILCLFLVIPFWDLGGFRMWTALHMFLYGYLMFMQKNKRVGLLICFFTWLVHYSFLFPLAILIVYLVAGNRLNIYFYAFLFTVFFAQLDIAVFNSYFERFAPSAINERSSSYRIEKEEDNSAAADEFSPKVSEKVWYARYYRPALFWSLNICMVFFYWKFKDEITRDGFYLKLFSFAFLFFSFAKLLSNIPSGGRFMNMAAMVSLIPLIYFVQNRLDERSIKKLFWVLSPFFFLFIVVTIRTGLYTISVATITSNPIVALLFGTESISLNDIIK
ncbi:EpsG family protein [Pararhodonellum marinum]|uniref:EpsG family protein n=1 Tax=Pararhodonellum marinum TaxID=2755358 RepID=UPI00188EC54A|nr:EpsG family protein [Pararhodonellum marinum]